VNKLDKQYKDLLQTILDYGVEKQDRTGTGTKSIFGYTIRHNMKDGFPLLTTKKMPWKIIVTELLWFLRGDTNIKYLVDNNCHIWDGDAYKNYCKIAESIEEPDYNVHVDDPNQNCTRLMTMEEFIDKIKTDDEFAKKWGELGPVYGKQWRNWGKKNVVNYDLENVKSSDKFKVMDLIRDGGDYSKYDVKVTYQNNSIDQIANLINDLKTNPDSRRLMVTAWNPSDLPNQVLPPCHYGFQVYTRPTTREEKIVNPGKYRALSLMWNQRSVDTFLGLPFNIASYGLLLTILAKEVNMVPDQLIGNLGDTHLYLNHIEQAKEQIGRELTDEERYNIWFTNNYETGMERFFDQELLPNFDDDHYQPTPKRTREPYPLPTLNQFPTYTGTRPSIESYVVDDFTLKDYQSHEKIKAPLSN
jgi:thymidylate synthase